MVPDEITSSRPVYRKLAERSPEELLFLQKITNKVLKKRQSRSMDTSKQKFPALTKLATPEKKVDSAKDEKRGKGRAITEFGNESFGNESFGGEEPTEQEVLQINQMLH